MALFTTPILLATDGSEEAQLAARAAIELTNRTDSELHVVHVWSPVGFPPSHSNPGVTWEGFSLSMETMGELEKQAHELLHEQIGKIEEAGGNVAEAHLRMGRPVEEILGLSERLGAGLVVVGSRGHSGIKRFVLGSVSESVVSHLHCSVLVVRAGEQNTSSGGSRWAARSR
jgi:nucleotide-binding universal stress UspA family protein